MLRLRRSEENKVDPLVGYAARPDQASGMAAREPGPGVWKLVSIPDVDEIVFYEQLIRRS